MIETATEILDNSTLLCLGKFFSYKASVLWVLVLPFDHILLVTGCLSSLLCGNSKRFLAATRNATNSSQRLHQYCGDGAGQCLCVILECL